MSRMNTRERSGRMEVYEIIGIELLPESSPNNDYTSATYVWHVDTKYYTADVNICAVQKRVLGDRDFADCVQAVVIYFNNADPTSFVEVNSWMAILKEYDPQVRLLVCAGYSVDPPGSVSKRETQEWCLDNSFELVEMDPIINSDDDDDFLPETTGVKRIVQALHAHLWPNLKMKERVHKYSPRLESMIQSHVCSSAEKVTRLMDDLNAENSVDGNGHSSDYVTGEAHQTQRTEENNDSLFNGEEDILKALVDDGQEGQSFDELFAKFSSMKAKARSLPMEERKLYAEKVAVAFWQAIGGDDDDIAGLDSDD